MADVPISGEYCTLTIEGVAIAATRTFTLNVDRATFGNFVARGTSKWRTNYVADQGWSIDFDGLVVVADTSPTVEQFDDHFTDLAAGTQLTIVFTLRTNTATSKTFIYTGEAYLTTLTAGAPQFGEATYSGTLLGTGALAQTTGTVS
ncbi:MAG: hypothetical protein GTO16_13790 [Candidatus Aminicenantes bacterium]|nr:hypothetical protein [Candidatus Aminicenantes bacterium]